MAREAFTWQDIDHWTLGDLMDTLRLIDTQELADDFMEVYADACKDADHALHNVRYMCDIISRDDDDDDAPDEAKRIADLFDVELPADDEVISPMQAWKGSSLGMKVAA